MPFSRTRTLFLLMALAFIAGPVRAQNTLPKERGYVDPRIVEGWFDERADTEISLDGPLLKMVAQGLHDRKPEAASLLGKLKGVYVRRYAGSSGLRPSALEKRTTALMDRLEDEGWQTVVRNHEQGQLVNIFVRTRGSDAISGLVVLKTTPGNEDGESVFVNIVGDVTPQQIGKLSGSIDGLGSFDFGSGLPGNNGGSGGGTE